MIATKVGKNGLWERGKRNFFSSKCNSRFFKEIVHAFVSVQAAFVCIFASLKGLFIVGLAAAFCSHMLLHHTYVLGIMQQRGQGRGKCTVWVVL